MANFKPGSGTDDAIDGVYNGIIGAEDHNPPPNKDVDQAIFELKKMQSVHHQRITKRRRSPMAV